ncbi:hypothetical protein ACTXT7_009679 [Hymenolepis weldensis]
MIVGDDETHPYSERRDIQESVAAVVASVSSDLMKCCSCETTGAQVERRNKYCPGVIGKHDNDKLSTKIIFYRNGVSEGQFYPVFKIELAAIQRACTNIRSGYEPGITFIVVQKRHHIRFTPIGGQ